MTDLWDEKLFDTFLANRLETTGKKKINTDSAVELLRSKCVKWHNIGYNVDAILENAIELGWQGLYLPKGMEPRQTHAKAAPEYQDLFSKVAMGHRMPRGRSAQEKHDRANKVRRDGEHAVANEALANLKDITRTVK